ARRGRAEQARLPRRCRHRPRDRRQALGVPRRARAHRDSPDRAPQPGGRVSTSAVIGRIVATWCVWRAWAEVRAARRILRRALAGRPLDVMVTHDRESGRLVMPRGFVLAVSKAAERLTELRGRPVIGVAVVVVVLAVFI